MVYPYDKGLYSRLFLNCFQRQSLVMLAERGAPVPQLLHRCLVSTDDMLRQIVREQRPKYAFDSELLAPDDLAGIGIVAEEVAFETYAEARRLLLDVVAGEGSAILVGDVFYWPHCPEYTSKHLVHTIVLKGFEPDTGQWSIIDDNPASVLCSYAYPEDVIAAGFDNNELRRVRYYTTTSFDADEGREAARRAFADRVDRYEDSHTLLTGVGDLLASRWIAPERAIAALHDVFSIYQGSRAGLAAYIRGSAPSIPGSAAEPEVAAVLDRIVARTADAQNQLLLGKVTGLLDVDRLSALCLGLKTAETELLHGLREVTRAREAA